MTSFVILIGQGKNDELEDGLAQPLLVDANERQDEDGDDCDDSEESSEESRRPATSIASAYRLLTPSVKVCFCMLNIILKQGVYQWS